jgi:hypothetical protein
VRRLILLISLLTALSPRSHAGGGSNYTIFGIGDLRLAGSVRTSGLGYAGLALADENGLNVNSPASWTRLKNTRIETSLLYEGFNARDGEKSLYVALTNFNGASLAIPISTANGIVFVGSMTPFSNRDYNVYTTGSQQGMDYVLNHVGKGGLGKGQVGLSYAPFEVLSLGASLNYLFGSLENTRTLLPVSDTFVGGETTGRTTANGLTGTFGWLFHGFGPLTPFSIGMTVTTRGYLGAEEEFLFKSEEDVDTLQADVPDIVVPASYAVGLSYQVGRRWAVTADFSQMLWSESGLASGARDATVLSMGIERLPLPETTAPLLDRMAFRIGTYYHETYYVVNGHPINEWGLTAGFGIPFSGENRINIAFEHGQRGSTAYGLLEESIFRFSFGVTISETWFLTFDEE